MRVNGHNILAILVAAALMYGIGALIYGVVFTRQWQEWSGVSMQGVETWRLALSPVMPLLQAIGLSLVMKWRNLPGAGAGIATGCMMALFFVFASNLYNLAYYNVHPGVTAIDALHLFAINMIGGAILGAWR